MCLKLRTIPTSSFATTLFDHPGTAFVPCNCLKMVSRANGAVHDLLNAPATPPETSIFVVFVVASLSSSSSSSSSFPSVASDAGVVERCRSFFVGVTNVVVSFPEEDG